MREGFYSIHQAGGDQDPQDGEAWGLAMLVHFGGGKVVGVDQGGCKIVGSYTEQPNGSLMLRMDYQLKGGSQLPNGTILEADHSLQREIRLTAGTIAGGHQPIDIGLGPMFIRLEWLAEGTQA